MTKLFISYRSLDSAKVDTLVARLRTLKAEDDTALYTVWQDKFGILAGQDWWQSIVDAISDCEVFVFMVSRESVSNINCRAELNYARRRNRPVIPVVLEGEFYHNPVSGKNDLEYWAQVPKELNDLRSQVLFYEGTSFVSQLAAAIAQFQQEPQKWRDIAADRPPDPRLASDETNSTVELYDDAYDFALKKAYETAQRWFQKLVNMNDPDFAEDAYAWINLLRDYQKILSYEARASTRHRARTAWETYIQQFPLPFIDMFDPDKVADRIYSDPASAAAPPASETVPQTPPAAKSEVSWMTADAAHYGEPDDLFAAPQAVHTEPLPTRTAEYLLPAPFAWIEIPGATVTITTDKAIFEEELPAYAIARYPVTNAQYAQFIEAGGYDQRRWWSKSGQNLIAKGIVEPLLWRDAAWNAANQPVVGVSWYEALAYCNWLSEVSGEQISLPSEGQWQFAAQGKSSSRPYPWGTKWNCERCNNAVRPCKSKGTTPVGQYEGKRLGDSPFGVVDMAGNVWEWCLSDYDIRDKAPDETMSRVVRGGSWINDIADRFRCDYRYKLEAQERINAFGFRIVRNYD